MSRQADEFIEFAGEIIRTASTHSDRRDRRRRRRQRRKRAWRRALRIMGAMAAAAVSIVVLMFAIGWFPDPGANRGTLAAPLGIALAWAAILVLGLRGQRTTPKLIAQSDLPQLPARTDEWLELQRRSLPSGAQRELDGIHAHLERLRPQLAALNPQTPAASELRQLLGQELPELIHGYQKVPPALQRQPLHGGPSPDSRLVEGLATIRQEIDRMHARLASDDLNALATQQRFLELKYKREDDLDE
jgi:hypothetical protein